MSRPSGLHRRHRASAPLFRSDRIRQPPIARWTAGVKDRVHRPFLFLRDKLVESSRLLGVLAAKFRFANSARFPPDDVDMRLVERAAEHYVRSRVYTEVMCRAFGIKCLYVIQPTSLVENNPSASAVLANSIHLASFRHDREIYAAGYRHILRKEGDRVLDASRLFEREDRVYLDVVHFNKRGSRLLGERIRRALEALSAESNSNP